MFFIIFQELLDKLAEEQHLHDTTTDQFNTAEKRASTYRAELDEFKALFERVSLLILYIYLFISYQSLFLSLKLFQLISD